MIVLIRSELGFPPYALLISVCKSVCNPGSHKLTAFKHGDAFQLPDGFDILVSSLILNLLHVGPCVAVCVHIQHCT